MSYRNYYRGGYPYYGRSYPLLDNRLYGALNEYAELNDVANRNNYIYANSVADNYCRPPVYTLPPRPSLYSLYNTSYAYPYAAPYLNPYGYGYPYL